MTALIGLTLSPNMQNSLKICAWKDRGVDATVREKATDIIKVEGNTITINPNSPDTAIVPVAGAADAKQAWYAVTDILLERHMVIAPGFHLEKYDTNAIRTVEAVLFEKRGGRWMCARRQNNEFIPIIFDDFDDNERARHARHNNQNKHDWIDMIAAGGKVTFEAPEGMLNYIGSILAAEPAAALKIIKEHEEKAIERDRTRLDSRWLNEAELVQSVIVDGTAIPVDDLNHKWLNVCSNGKNFTVRGSDRKHLTQLVNEGATFSF